MRRVFVLITCLLAGCVGNPRPSVPSGGADLNEQLIAAAWADDVPRARDLIAAGADVNHRDDSVQSAFLIAASEGYRELLELTLQHGADVASTDSYHGTALIRAAERGHDLVVGRLLQTAIAVDHVNNLGWTALHEAIWLGDAGDAALATVELLIAGGADLEAVSRHDGLTPLQQARQRGFTRMADSLRTARERPVPGDPAAALLAAADDGDSVGVALAVRAGATLEVRDGNGRTPLLLAASADRVPAARLLVALGADPDALDGRHDTPWLVTGVTGSVAMGRTVLLAGPDLTIRNRFGGVSVIPASERGHVDYVRWVVTTGIDVDHVNDLGWTALLEAVILGDGSQRYVDIVDILLSAGANPNLADREGRTPRQHALQRGFTRIAELLA